MDSNVGVLISVADPEVGTAIAANVDLLPSAPASFLLAGDDVTVSAAGHAGVQGHIQIPKGEEELDIGFQLQQIILKFGNNPDPELMIMKVL